MCCQSTNLVVLAQLNAFTFDTMSAVAHSCVHAAGLAGSRHSNWTSAAEAFNSQQPTLRLNEVLHCTCSSRLLWRCSQHCARQNRRTLSLAELFQLSWFAKLAACIMTACALLEPSQLRTAASNGHMVPGYACGRQVMHSTVTRPGSCLPQGRALQRQVLVPCAADSCRSDPACTMPVEVMRSNMNMCSCTWHSRW
jgi:hypothetical protein